MGDQTRLRDRVTRDRLLLAAVLVIGIAGTGIVRRQLGVLGFNDLGRLVFIFGYGLTVFAVWYGWIRPLDITGPDAERDVSPSDSSVHASAGDESEDETGGSRGDPTAPASDRPE